MGFADELKKLPDQKKNEEIVRNEKMIKDYCDNFYEFFKLRCKYNAGEGRNEFGTSLGNVNEHVLQQSDESTKNKFSKDLSEEDALFFETYIKNKLSKEGFESYDLIRIPHPQYRTEYEHVEYTSGEKLFGGILNAIGAAAIDTDGYEKKIRVKDGFRYDFKVAVKW